MARLPAPLSGGRRLVILHVLEDLGPGGSEGQVLGFVIRSDADRFQHVVCALSEAGRLAARLDDAGVPLYVLRTPGNDIVRSVVRLRRLVHQVKPDLIHATLYRPAVVSRIVGTLCDKPVVTTLVNTAYEPESLMDNPRLSWRKVRLVRAVDRLSAQWGTWFVAVNEVVKASAVTHLDIPPGRISIIPRGIPFGDGAKPAIVDQPTARSALGWPAAYPVILNVGRLIPQKGQRYAILAMPHILERFPAARLYIAGEGWLRGDLEHVIRDQGLDDHAMLLGERADIDVLLSAADIFVFPSLSEGAANALMEAMAARKPCVVSGIASLREATGDGKVALVADPRSPVSLAAHILRLADDRELGRHLGSDAHAWVKAHFDLEMSVKALEALYETLLLAP